MDLEIEKSLVVSTTHVLQSDMDLLEQGAYPYTVHNYREGAIIYIVKDMVIPVEQSIEFISDGSYEESIVAFSRDFRRVLKLAQQNDCTWLRLDCDGSIIKGLPQNDW